MEPFGHIASKKYQICWYPLPQLFRRSRRAPSPALRIPVEPEL
jgi:hypothetical protein